MALLSYICLSLIFKGLVLGLINVKIPSKEVIYLDNFELDFTDGERDGFFIMYKKGDKIYPVAIDQVKLKFVKLILNDLTIVEDMGFTATIFDAKKKESIK